MKQGMSNCENELKASQKIESCCPRGTRLRSDVSYFYYQKEKEKKRQIGWKDVGKDRKWVLRERWEDEMNCCSCRAVVCFMPQAPHRDGCCSQHSSLWLQGSHAHIQLQLLPFLLSNRMQCLYHLSAMLIAMANTELASCCSQCSLLQQQLLGLSQRAPPSEPSSPLTQSGFRDCSSLLPLPLRTEMPTSFLKTAQPDVIN